MRATIDLPEPVYQILQSRAEQRGTSDAHLAAIAMDAGFRLIAFDRGMDRWQGPALELLMPAQA